MYPQWHLCVTNGHGPRISRCTRDFSWAILRIWLSKVRNVWNSTLKAWASWQISVKIRGKKCIGKTLAESRTIHRRMSSSQKEFFANYNDTNTPPIRRRVGKTAEIWMPEGGFLQVFMAYPVLPPENSTSEASKMCTSPATELSEWNLSASCTWYILAFLGCHSRRLVQVHLVPLLPDRLARCTVALMKIAVILLYRAAVFCGLLIVLQ